MRSLAEVQLWGTTIGAVSLEAGEESASFQYDPAFLASGIQPSPLAMPLSERIYRFPELARASFHGLPGMLSDCLPDRFGNALINSWLAAQGREPASLNAVERLCYSGSRGMGALEFHPLTGPRTRKAEQVQIEALVELASAILSHRKGLRTSLRKQANADALAQLLRVGTSAGGARAKAVIAWNPLTGEVRSGQVPADAGFEHWLLKFDGVSGNRDKESTDPLGFGAIEYAYHRMAQACGIRMSPCRLLEESGRQHFMTRRFDRTAEGDKLHMQSLGALAHLDFNQSDSNSYEQAFLVLRRLGLPMESTEQLFRRMVFNIVARNQDDHVKNIAFLMDRRGRWSLAPAFDLTFSCNPAGAWTSRHQMSVNGKRDQFAMEDFKACARGASMKRGQASSILEEVQAVVGRWRDFAKEAGVQREQREAIFKVLRTRPIGD